MKGNQVAAMISSLLILTGCSSDNTESDKLETSDIQALITIKATSDSRSRITAELNRKRSTGANVSLSQGDYITAYAQGQLIRLKKDHDILDIDYQGYLDSADSYTQFTFALMRENFENAPDSRVDLPANFEIHSPQENTHYIESDNIDINWDSLSEYKTMEIRLNLNCKNKENPDQETIETEDDGFYTLDIDQIEMFNTVSAGTKEDCMLTVTLTRRNKGEIDPHLDADSMIQAIQVREVSDLIINI
ncbi:hypothetical protein [Pseudoalteromonas denitrificans]|jgi:hypothetical protein|uniref:Lipoprotein n=1 Tax=Pseudoalteromonas denitrificans DSM 6059 TaxID=1123010 RepID=A0A1I1SUU3_9GAMM|nr:hypothetical protein [Pseudoalteromonas denitrificans]SFD50122.1 hypothetical protein SAMN02745724_04693 [Pseudoalteromonas denitrificans DSM 6059]